MMAIIVMSLFAQIQHCVFERKASKMIKKKHHILYYTRINSDALAALTKQVFHTVQCIASLPLLCHAAQYFYFIFDMGIRIGCSLEGRVV